MLLRLQHKQACTGHRSRSAARQQLCARPSALSRRALIGATALVQQGLDTPGAEDGPGVREGLQEELPAMLSSSAVVYPEARTQSIGKLFPGAVGSEKFLTSLQAALSKFGVTPKDSIALVNLCRDEATDALKESIDRAWGHSFNTNGLGGVLTCGATGIKAGLSHAPVLQGDQEHYIFFSLPHVAVDSSGALGKIQRPGRAKVSSACGALGAALGELQGKGVVGLGEGGWLAGDLEYCVLKTRLSEMLKTEGLSDQAAKSWSLVDMTKAAERLITADLEALIAKTVDTTKATYAVVAGVQIHSWPVAGERGPALEYIWPQKTYVVVNGQRKELGLSAKMA